ncbi:MAG TPA: type II toxin-antitoxin system PemK/MazF family toxin [Microbacteriaceae bacterium]|nr:type II toxin-antitoxin system PemK/MazF family toxin [Microbacteriaceae bacterium]
MTRLHRGDIVLVSLDPTIGTEANKTRPCVVVSNAAVTAAASLRGNGVVTVIPLTSNVARMWPNHVLLRSSATGLPTDSKAQTEQIRAIDVRRILNVIGSVPAEHMAEVDEAIRFHLAV